MHFSHSLTLTLTRCSSLVYVCVFDGHGRCRVHISVSLLLFCNRVLWSIRHWTPRCPWRHYDPLPAPLATIPVMMRPIVALACRSCTNNSISTCQTIVKLIMSSSLLGCGRVANSMTALSGTQQISMLALCKH